MICVVACYAVGARSAFSFHWLHAVLQSDICSPNGESLIGHLCQSDAPDKIALAVPGERQIAMFDQRRIPCAQNTFKRLMKRIPSNRSLKKMMIPVLRFLPP